MIKYEELLKNGYSNYTQNLLDDHPLSKFQKQVKDKRGIKYYINCSHGEEFEAILILSNSSLFTVTIKYWNSLRKIEESIHKIWKDTRCKYIEEFPQGKGRKYRQIDLEEQIAEEKGLNGKK